MQFWVFAAATLPDVDTARRVHDLEDLDDAGVFKVMQHHARQRHYPPGTLAPEQQRIASLTLAYASRHGFRFDTLSLADATEVEMLEALCEAVAMGRPLLYWDSGAQALRMLENRMFVHGVACPAYWSAKPEQGTAFVDVAARLQGRSATWQDLDERARAIGLPGLMGLSDGDMLQPLPDDLSATIDLAPQSEIAALNLLLIGARWFLINGDLAASDVTQLGFDLRNQLAGSNKAHHKAFLDNWEDR